MRPAMSAKVMKALDDSIAHLEQLRAPLQLALSRDEEPPLRNEAHEDHVGKTVKMLGNKLIAIDVATASILKIAKDVHKPLDDQATRVASIPDCIACGYPALPRPKREMCWPCYDRYRNSKFTDVIEFIRVIRSEQEASNVASEASGESGILDARVSA